MTLTEAVAAATTAWFTPRPSGLAAPFVPNGAVELEVESDGAGLAGFTIGDGPSTVLLVHGWASSIGHMAPLIPVLLGSGYRVAGFDLPGHGASGGSQTNVYELACAIRAFADHIGGVDAIIAHSIGAPATVEATRAGLRSRAVVFIAPGTRLRDAFDVFVTRADLPQPVAAGLETEIERRFGTSVWEDLQIVNAVGDLAHLPALLIHDPEDPQSPIDGVRAVASRWQGSRLVEVGDVGHNRILRDPDVLAEVVAFLGVSLPERVG